MGADSHASAAKSGEWDQVASLDAGADDYLMKPVSMTVLLAHVRALVRRSQLFEARFFATEGLSLDPIRHSCSIQHLSWISRREKSRFWRS